MSIQTVFPGSQEEPPEYAYTNPINCVVCGEEWDADDHLDDEFHYHSISGEPVCLGKCDTILTEALEDLDDDEYDPDIEDYLDADEYDFELTGIDTDA